MRNIKIPDESDSKFQYNSNIGKINPWIENSVDTTIGRQLVKFKQPKEAWEYLSCLYTQSNSAKIYQLECEIKYFEQGNNNIHDFYIR